MGELHKREIKGKRPKVQVAKGKREERTVRIES